MFAPLNQSSLRSLVLNILLSVSLVVLMNGLIPLYSLALNSSVGGLVGNLVMIALALFTVVQVWLISQFASALIMPVVLWVAIATTTVLSELGWI